MLEPGAGRPRRELKSGQITDDAFDPVPIQRDGHENNALIKSDAVPVEWGKTTTLQAQKDIDARWTKKGGQQDESGWKIASANLDCWKGGVAGKDRQLELT